MNPESPTSASDNGAAPAGLPPVTPPSGRFIAQLFLVPGMIVVIAVLIIAGVSYLAVPPYTPEYFLGKLDSDNADVRWRGASDLAQRLERKEPRSQPLRTDVGFALDLAQRLRRAFHELTAAEGELRAKADTLPKNEALKARRKLEPQQAYVDFVASALGDFYVPVGAAMLCEIMNHEAAPDQAAAVLRRRKAVFALANLGNNVKAARVELSEVQRQAIVSQLRAEKDGGDPERSAWAQTALHYLAPGDAGIDAAKLVLVDHELAKAARSEDRFLRVQVALALNFWDGDLVEATLLRLTRDDGFGTLIRVGEVE